MDVKIFPVPMGT